MGTPSLTRGLVYRLQLQLALTSAVILESECRGTHGHILQPKIRDSRRVPEIFQLNNSSHSPYVTSSLTRGLFCRLQLLLILASAFILKSESRRAHDHSLLSQIRDSPNLEASSPYLYPSGRGWPSYNPRHWIPFTSPLTTRRTTVEVIRTLLRTLEKQSAITWRINSRRTEYKTSPQILPPLYIRIRCFAGRTGKVEFYVTTDGQSVSPPRNRAPIWSPRPDLHHCMTVAVPPIRGTLPWQEDGSATHTRCRSSTAQSISSPSPVGAANTLHSLRFEVAYYDSQAHGGGTRPLPHTGLVIFIIFLSYMPSWHYYLCIIFRVFWRSCYMCIPLK
jgi:hypothetical protein